MSFHCSRAEHKGQFFEELEKEFDKTLRTLVTGIIHDFANSLSGILGRSEFLEEDVVNIIENVENKHSSVECDMLEGYKKIIYDIGLITKQGNKLRKMFSTVAGKFHALSDMKWQEINLSELIEAEAAFLQFYPTVKCDIKQKLILNRKIPPVTGIKNEYSLAFSALIRHALNSVQGSKIQEVIISTWHDDSYVWVKIKYTGTPGAQIPTMETSEDSIPNCPDEAKGLFNAVQLLKEYGVLFQISYASGFNVMSIQIPWSKR